MNANLLYNSVSRSSQNTFSSLFFYPQRKRFVIEYIFAPYLNLKRPRSATSLFLFTCESLTIFVEKQEITMKLLKIQEHNLQ